MQMKVHYLGKSKYALTQEEINSLTLCFKQFNIKKVEQFNEFSSIKNLEYHYINETSEYANVMNELISNKTDSTLLSEEGALERFNEYYEYNKKIASTLEVSDDDIIIINNSEFLLVPLFVSCNVAIRDFKFSRSIITDLFKLDRIIDSITKSNVYLFFNDIVSYNEFTNYLEKEFQSVDINRIYYIDPYVDKETIYEVLLMVDYTIDHTDSLKKKIKNEIVNKQVKRRNFMHIYNIVDYTQLHILKESKEVMFICDPEYLELLEDPIKAYPHVTVAILDLGNPCYIKNNDELRIKYKKIKHFYLTEYGIKVFEIKNKYQAIIALISASCYLGLRHRNYAEALKCKYVPPMLSKDEILEYIFSQKPGVFNSRILDVNEYIAVMMKFMKYKASFSNDVTKINDLLDAKVNALIKKYRRGAFKHKIVDSDLLTKVYYKKSLDGFFIDGCVREDYDIYKYAVKEGKVTFTKVDELSDDYNYTETSPIILRKKRNFNK